MKKSILNSVGSEITFVLAGSWGEPMNGKIIKIKGELVRMRIDLKNGEKNYLWIHESLIMNVMKKRLDMERR